MPTKLFVANLPYNANENDLKDLFEEHAAVKSAKIIIDKETNKSKGFGFVELQDSDDFDRILGDLNGADFQGRKLVVNEAKPQTPRG